MKPRTLITIAASLLFISCSNGQANKNTNPISQTMQPADSFQFTLETAHPNAKDLMKEDFYFSPIEETGPFGSDDGWEAAYGFRKWRMINIKESPLLYLKELISGWGYPHFDWNEMDSLKIKDYIDQRKELPESEIQQNIQTLKAINAQSPDTSFRNLTDAQLRDIVLSSNKGMNGIYLLGQDNAIIGTGFAQFVLEGRIDQDIKVLTIAAIRRQLLPILISRYDEPFQEKRKQQLTKMLEVVTKAKS